MNVLNLFKNNLIRILAKKEIVIIAVVIVPLMIGVAILFSGKIVVRQHIALVTTHAQNLPKNDRIKIDVMNKKPATSNLLLGKYAAVVEEKSDGTYEVTSIKSKADKELIENFFNFGKISKSNQSGQAKRGVGTNILGFILMIILMQGVALTILYPEDRTLKTFRRILTSSVSEKQYIFAQGIFTFLCLFIPTYLVIVITKVCFNIKIGFGLLMLAILIGILTALSTSLALLISSMLERNISLVASAIYVITCILSGCYYSFTGNNKVFDTICSILPQKSYMTLIQGIENRNSLFYFKGQLIYLFIWIAALWFLGSIITKRKMDQGIY